MLRIRLNLSAPFQTLDSKLRDLAKEPSTLRLAQQNEPASIHISCDVEVLASVGAHAVKILVVQTPEEKTPRAGIIVCTPEEALEKLAQCNE